MCVAAAQAKIVGPEDVYVKKGSTISLTCTVNVQSTPPSSVSWHHGGDVVDFDSPRYKPRESSSRVFPVNVPHPSPPRIPRQLGGRGGEKISLPFDCLALRLSLVHVVRKRCIERDAPSLSLPSFSIIVKN